MTQVNNESVSPEIKAILNAMQRQIDECTQRVVAAETRATAAENRASIAEARILELEKQIKEKDAKITRLKETVAKYQNMFFGTHIEKTKYLNIGTQLSLFGEEQPEAHLPAAPTVPVSGHNRQ